MVNKPVGLHLLHDGNQELTQESSNCSASIGQRNNQDKAKILLIGLAKRPVRARKTAKKLFLALF
jgi:hypothetical protein